MINLSRKDKNLETKTKKKMNLFLKILLILFIAILIFVITVFATSYFYINSKLDKIEYSNLTKTDVYIDENVEQNLVTYRNIALLGIDAREDTFEKGNRSDCIMIISINETTKDIKILSVYRDTYVQIDGYGLDKVTHAYSYGGAKLALDTLNKNLDLNISEFVAINFDTVRTAVDCVGGVTINVDSQEVNYINGYINSLNKQFGTSSANIKTPGTYNLDGVQALAYSRIRYTEGGDHKRAERMREVLMASFNKAKSMDLSKLNSLLDTILPHIYTNIQKNEIISIIPQAISYNVTDSFGWPYETKGITKDRWYGVPVDLEYNVSKLHQELFNEPEYVPSNTVKDISKKIVNSTGYKK